MIVGLDPYYSFEKLFSLRNEVKVHMKWNFTTIFFSYLKIGVFRNILMGKEVGSGRKKSEVGGTYFNNRRKLGVLDKD